MRIKDWPSCEHYVLSLKVGSIMGGSIAPFHCKCGQMSNLLPISSCFLLTYLYLPLFYGASIQSIWVPEK